MDEQKARELEIKFEELSRKYADIEAKQKETMRILESHTHVGNDGSASLYRGDMLLKPGTAIRIGRTSLEELTTDTAERGLMVIGNDATFSGFANKLKSLQLTYENQPSTDTGSNQSFIYASRYPVYVGKTSIIATSGGTTLVQYDFNWTVNELAGAYVNIYSTTNPNATLVYTRQIASNTSSTITIDGTWPSTVSGGGFLVVMPAYFGAADFPWRQGYFVGQDVSSAGDGGQRRVMRFGYGTTSGADVISLYFGTGSPENVVTANTGSLFLRTDGSTSTTLYVKTADDGAATGWTAK